MCNKRGKKTLERDKEKIELLPLILKFISNDIELTVSKVLIGTH